MFNLSFTIFICIVIQICVHERRDNKGDNLRYSYYTRGYNNYQTRNSGILGWNIPSHLWYTGNN